MHQYISQYFLKLADRRDHDVGPILFLMLVIPDCELRISVFLKTILFNTSAIVSVSTE